MCLKTNNIVNFTVGELKYNCGLKLLLQAKPFIKFKTIENNDILFNIPLEYFDINSFRLWVKLFNIYEKVAFSINNIPKPLIDNSFEDNIDIKYINALNEESFENLKNFIVLMNYLQINNFLQLASAFIAHKFLKERKYKEIKKNRFI